jgi:hypothetical protein
MFKSRLVTPNIEYKRTTFFSVTGISRRTNPGQEKGLAVSLGRLEDCYRLSNGRISPPPSTPYVFHHGGPPLKCPQPGHSIVITVGGVCVFVTLSREPLLLLGLPCGCFTFSGFDAHSCFFVEERKQK